MKINRLISIIIILLQRKKISALELSNMFEVNIRTIYRDIETISQSGIPIITYRGPQGGIGIMDEYKIENKLFTSSDITELLIGLNSIHSTLSDDELINTMAKIKGLLPKEDIERVEGEINKIKIDHTPWFDDKRTKLSLESIKKAIKENKLIYFKYFNRLNEKSERIIEPYRLILKNSQWYIQGYCTLRKDYRIFAISNISSLEIKKETFIPRAFDCNCEDITFRTNRQIITLKLLVEEALLDTMVSFCGEENITPTEDNKYICYFPFVEDDYFYNKIIQFGDKCECLEPEYIRNNIIKKIENLLSVYKSSK